ncbi:MAG: carboxypeptidase-like regulatory domain-containing protein [Bacteroidota bacterium]|nr:carboxypeptidase-like regulatory domain-containing protein [Bacteroidota bacterium]MEE3148898.1 carboxypeptidase-like regulatory domain-containing protein [Bacteroidota bacterium]
MQHSNYKILICIILLSQTLSFAKERSLGAFIESSSTLVSNVERYHSSLCLLNLHQQSLNTEPEAELVLTLKTTQKSFDPNSRHTLVFEVYNQSKASKQIKVLPILPTSWQLLSVSAINHLAPAEKKLVLVQFFIPSYQAAGQAPITVNLNTQNELIRSKNYTINVATHQDIRVEPLPAAPNLEGGTLFKSSFEIKNMGNQTAALKINSSTFIDGFKEIQLKSDADTIIVVQQSTPKLVHAPLKVINDLEVENVNTQEKKYAYNSTTIYPSKIKQKDPFFRYMIDASVYYNSFTNSNDHFSIMTAEVKGNGFLDIPKEHFLSFIVRGPQKINVRRFGITDQYSLIYRYKDATTVKAGDHGYQLNRLGFGSRFGIGFSLDHSINSRLTFSALYVKPRLYTSNNSSFYGVKAQYLLSPSFGAGISISQSKESVYRSFSQKKTNNNDFGQIATINFDYQNARHFLYSETSLSNFKGDIQYAQMLNAGTRLGNFRFNGNFTVAAKNYFGTVSNGLQLNTNITYAKNKWNLSLGQSLSKIIQNIDPRFSSAAPYFKNYFARLGFKIDQASLLSIRLDHRLREDRLMPRNYFYKEMGMDYQYSLNLPRLNLNFNGRIAKTKNMLLTQSYYLNNYFHGVNINYNLLKAFSVRGGFNHSYTSRYSLDGKTSHNYRYSLGLSTSINALRFNLLYTSGFTPEYYHLKRDYLNASIFYSINNHHHFEIRANYYENPGFQNAKEVLASAKYTYRFGIPLKRTISAGGIKGYIQVPKNYQLKEGIELSINGKTVVADKNGYFEINNVSVGKQFLFVDQSKLPKHLILGTKNPIELDIIKNQSQDIIIPLVEAASLRGNLNKAPKDSFVPKMLIHLKNDENAYTLRSNPDGTFHFKEIIPGSYDLNFQFLGTNMDYKAIPTKQITLNAASAKSITIDIEKKVRQVIFKSKKLYISN